MDSAIMTTSVGDKNKWMETYRAGVFESTFTLIVNEI